MSTQLCPSAVTDVSALRVWALLKNPARYGAWMDAQTVAVEPPGEAVKGQMIEMRLRAVGLWWPLTLTVTLVDPARFAIGFSGAFRRESPCATALNAHLSARIAAGFNTAESLRSHPGGGVG